MNRHEPDALNLGADVLARLLPHRRPFLLVDRVTHYSRGPRPTLRAQRHVSAGEPVFAGHFPGFHLWPGAYIQEGLGQSCNVLGVLLSLQRAWETQGGAAEDVLTALRQLELGYRLDPGFNADEVKPLLEQLLSAPSRLIGFVAAVDMKFLAPVFAGQRIDYEVRQAHVVGNMVRFELNAAVDGQEVARGNLTGTTGVMLPSLLVP